mmetsp:Transcript_1388/g.2619  ORF Transcript_1388/g.2619 Transcript_1388/m.2619 type:complete len:229 (+) Transcript_1388:134-820(+)
MNSLENTFPLFLRFETFTDLLPPNPGSATCRPGGELLIIGDPRPGQSPTRRVGTTRLAILNAILPISIPLAAPRWRGGGNARRFGNARGLLDPEQLALAAILGGRVEALPGGGEPAAVLADRVLRAVLLAGFLVVVDVELVSGKFGSLGAAELEALGFLPGVVKVAAFLEGVLGEASAFHVQRSIAIVQAGGCPSIPIGIKRSQGRDKLRQDFRDDGRLERWVFCRKN